MAQLKEGSTIGGKEIETTEGAQAKVDAVVKSPTVQLGENAAATGEYSVAIGLQARAGGDYATTALGERAAANQNGAMALGTYAEANSYYTVALGSFSKADGSNSISIGLDSYTNGIGAVAVGRYTSAAHHESVAIGEGAYTRSEGQGVLGDIGPYTTNSWLVPGNLSVGGAKNFEIPHPHPDKKNTHVLRHGAVESPTPGDTLYRFMIEAKKDGETVEMQLPDYFQYLNKDIDVWVNGHMHFGRAFGWVEGSILKVTCEKAGQYKALVIGTRNDDAVQDWYIKGVEREIGETWKGETASFEVDEIIEIDEIIEEDVA